MARWQRIYGNGPGLVRRPLCARRAQFRMFETAEGPGMLLVLPEFCRWRVPHAGNTRSTQMLRMPYEFAAPTPGRGHWHSRLTLLACCVLFLGSFWRASGERPRLFLPVHAGRTARQIQVAADTRHFAGACLGTRFKRFCVETSPGKEGATIGGHLVGLAVAHFFQASDLASE